MDIKQIQASMETLQRINWDFSDYNSSKYPLDLNSVPWYPATFIPPIPRLLIASLTSPGDKVFDPFGGKGTTAIETLLQNRIPIYNDLNPFATEIFEGLLAAIKYCTEKKEDLNKEKDNIKRHLITESEIEKYILKNGISSDVVDWFHTNTLAELLSIHNLISNSNGNNKDLQLIRKLAMTSILKPASSQSGHFTYVTDNCKPSEKKQKKAITLYLEKIEQITLAANDFLVQYNFSYPDGKIEDLLRNTVVNSGNAKALDWVEDESVDLVVTSPPYLCAQDYIKTMRLTNLFFENKAAFDDLAKQEIGPRNSRRGKSSIVVPNFYSDMDIVFRNIHRVLKTGSCFCLVIGQGKSKITAEYQIIDDLSKILQERFNFKLLFRKERAIGNRVIQIGGVDKEEILIYRK